VHTSGGGGSKFGDTYNVCLSDYHGAEEGLLVIMRVVPASFVKHHDLVSVVNRVSPRFHNRPKRVSGEKRARDFAPKITTRKLFDVYGSQSERFLRCRMQVTVRVRLMAGTEHRISLSVQIRTTDVPRLGLTKNVRKGE